MGDKGITQLMGYGFASVPQLLLERYKQLHMTDNELMLILHIYSFSIKGNTFPSIDQIRSRMSATENEIMQMLHKLHRNRLIDIQNIHDQQERVTERFVLDPLWEKLAQLDEVPSRKEAPLDWTENDTNQQSVDGEVFRRFEVEFGRAFSPFEAEMISKWLDEDGHSPKMVLLALKEAVLANKRSLRYIDKILLEWQKKGVRTEEDIFHQRRTVRPSPTVGERKKSKTVSFPFYNWLEK